MSRDRYGLSLSSNGSLLPLASPFPYLFEAQQKIQQEQHTLSSNTNQLSNLEQVIRLFRAPSPSFSMTTGQTWSGIPNPGYSLESITQGTFKIKMLVPMPDQFKPNFGGVTNLGIKSSLQIDFIIPSSHVVPVTIQPSAAFSGLVYYWYPDA